MRKSKMFFLAYLSIVLLLLLGVVVLAAAAEDDRILVPDFALLTVSNETIRLSDHRGQVVVLNFWASWCPPCRSEMSEFQELNEELAQSGEAVLFLLNQIDGRTETVETGTDFLAAHGFTMTNLFDYGMVGPQIFGIPGLPTTVVIDAEGYLSSYVVGATNKATVLQMIEGAK